MSAPHPHYLDFERPIAELEAKIDDLSRLAEAAEAEGAKGLEDEILALKVRVGEMRQRLYGSLDAWQKTQVARHPDRPHLVDYLAALMEDFVELKGDRAFADDQAIMGGTAWFRGQPVVVIGHEKGYDTATRIKHNFGMARPEGYRKAVRLMNLAERFSLPVVSFVDTAGAYPGKEGEERGQGEAVARCTERCLTLKTPMVAAITGEGGSGGAIALAAANTVLMLEHSIYSVIAPESGSSILYRDRAQAPHMARAMKITGEDLLRFGIVDAIVPEPPGGAHADPPEAMRRVGDAVEAALGALEPLGPEALVRQRAERFYAIGSTGLKV
jgi:acetyl-CoA carboxylase carboxyl transferase subunit alpha